MARFFAGRKKALRITTVEDLAVSVGGRGAGCTREGVGGLEKTGVLYIKFFWCWLVGDAGWCWSVGWLGGWLVGWLAGWLVCWLVGWLGGREVGEFFLLASCCNYMLFLVVLACFLDCPCNILVYVALSVFFCHLNSLCFVFFTRVLRRWCGWWLLVGDAGVIHLYIWCEDQLTQKRFQRTPAEFWENRGLGRWSWMCNTFGRHPPQEAPTVW